MNFRGNRWPGVFILGFVVLLGASMASAQAVSSGTVTGSVILPDGTPSPGATVVLEGPALVRGNWATVSDARGTFVFLRVPPGTYKVTASLSGFNTAKVEDIAISSSSTPGRRPSPPPLAVISWRSYRPSAIASTISP
jgi:hypothetical protein